VSVSEITMPDLQAAERPAATPRSTAALLRQLTLATAGSASADGACRVAFDLAGRLDVPLHVLAVGEGTATAPADVVRQLARLQKSLQHKDQLCSLQGVARDVIPLVVGGLGSDMLILGRPTGMATTQLTVVRRTTIPVLCVNPEAQGAPRRVLCAVDGTWASIRAARAGVALLGAGPGVLTCAHHWTPDLDADLQVEALVRAELHIPTSVAVSLVEWRSRSADAVLALVTDRQPDVLTLGRPGDSPFASSPRGRVGETLIKEAACSVLVAR
jgi:universal stress protein family protein